MFPKKRKKPKPKENKCRQNLDRGKSSRTPWKRQRQRLEYSSRPQPHPYRPHRDVEAGALALLLNGRPLPCHSLSLSILLSWSPLAMKFPCAPQLTKNESESCVRLIHPPTFLPTIAPPPQTFPLPLPLLLKEKFFLFWRSTRKASLRWRVHWT